jgi:Lrp/AsnC family leucine-responsive transcriptional regulator
VEKLDLKDKKILFHLDLNSRQSFSQIGKKVGLHKDVVAYRVKKLQEKGIIIGYSTVVDYSKLGYNLYRFYFTFQNTTPTLKNEIIDYFINEKYVGFVKSLEGNYDLLVGIFVENYLQAHSFWQKSLKNYGKYFLKKVFTAYCQVEQYAYRFLLDEKDSSQLLICQWIDSGKSVEIDDLDYQIIKLITQNSRLSTIDIAKELGKTSIVIHNRLKKLMELDIILAYRLQIDFPKIGYYNYKVDIELNKFDKVDSILEFFKSNPNFEFMCKTIGYVDLEVAFYFNSHHQIRQLMEDLSNKYPGVIKNYSYFSFIRVYKDYEPLRFEN